MINEWIDVKAGDPWPTDKKFIKALDRTLNTIPGENPDQYVALWYNARRACYGTSLEQWWKGERLTYTP